MISDRPAGSVEQNLTETAPAAGKAEDTESGDGSETVCAEEEKPLPEALERLRTRNVLIGFLVIVFALGFAFAEREGKLSVLSLFGVWFLYTGLSVKQRYRTGKIAEKLLICTSVRKSVLRNGVSVGFRTEEEYPVFYHYEAAGRHVIDEFHPNGVYLVYYAEETPSLLLAWSEL